MGSKAVWQRTLTGLAILVLSVSLLFAVIFILILRQVPSAEKIRGCLVTTLYEVNLCPKGPNYTRLDFISLFLQKAIVLSEDSSFWSHNGFDFVEIQRSLEKNLEKGTFARGGSTITQQLAKNMFLSSDKTMIRKIIEAVITTKIERTLSKKEILERYLNVVEFGPDIYGVKAAADFYFKKTPAQLDVTESAFLAFVLPNPDVYSVSFYKKELTKFARKRLTEIISRLYQYQRITASEYETAGRRLGSFFIGAAPPSPPKDMNFNLPEDEMLLLESFDHSVDRHLRDNDGNNKKNENITEDPGLNPFSDHGSEATPTSPGSETPTEPTMEQ